VFCQQADVLHVRRIFLSLSIGALLMTAGPALAQDAAPGTSAHAAAGGASAPQPEGSGASGGASYGTLQQLDAEKAAKRRAAVRKRAAARRALARKRAKTQARARAKVEARRGAAKRRAAKRVPKPAPVVPAPTPTSDHSFPVGGPFTIGSKDGRFGAGRPGHIHQGQDISAASGTPVVAPWPSIVEAVKYQAGGAGYYVVLDGDNEDRDYAFMHLLKDSTVVKVGDHVERGQQIAQVGSTGSSSGPHLHFEIWVGGGWYTGGQPVDPLPFLQAWM
jgi:murein DD-endopeptidase MepM/ murein hydrolase activator NlpD